ncbi:MAG: FdtA/QdtA family cupin domain-containing protein [Kiloniellales bacterium]
MKALTTDNPVPALHGLGDAHLIPLPSFPAETGTLWAMEGCGAIPFAIARVFGIRAPAGARRGAHAHRRCTQAMVCLSGRCEIMLDDGASQEPYLLSFAQASALLVPPSIWAEQRYLDDDSVLLVLCDRPFEPEDYIRDYDAFLAWRQASCPVER